VGAPEGMMLGATDVGNSVGEDDVGDNDGILEVVKHIS